MRFWNIYIYILLGLIATPSIVFGQFSGDYNGQVYQEYTRDQKVVLLEKNMIDLWEKIRALELELEKNINAFQFIRRYQIKREIDSLKEAIHKQGTSLGKIKDEYQRRIDKRNKINILSQQHRNVTEYMERYPERIDKEIELQEKELRREMAKMRSGLGRFTGVMGVIDKLSLPVSMFADPYHYESNRRAVDNAGAIERKLLSNLPTKEDDMTRGEMLKAIKDYKEYKRKRWLGFYGPPDLYVAYQRWLESAETWEDRKEIQKEFKWFIDGGYKAGTSFPEGDFPRSEIMDMAL